MFAALYLPSLSGRTSARALSARGPRDTPGPPRALINAQLITLAREFSPRVECVRDNLLALDITGFSHLFEGPRELGEALRRTAADRGLAPHVAVAATRTAALVSARGRAGLTVVPPGEEASRVAPLPLSVLVQTDLPLATLRRWGLKTLGDLATLPAVELSERLGQAGVVWQRLARGEDLEPLVPVLPDERFEESLELEWPVDTLEPLSFVLGRLFESLCERLEQADRGVAVLHVRLDLVGAGGRERFARALQLPAPMRDARTLRTLALLDLESNPPPAPIDRVTVAAEVVEGRVLQFSLLERALSVERASTLLARLSALVGADRVGAAALVDSNRPGDFAMVAFEAAPAAAATSASASQRLRPSLGVGTQATRGGAAASGGGAPRALNSARRLPAVVRRFRHPIPARVEVQQGCPVRVTSERRHLRGGDVEVCAGPWRTSGNWWSMEKGSGRLPTSFPPWDRDEWDVSLRDGARYVVFRDRRRGHWFIDGILD